MNDRQAAESLRNFKVASRMAGNVAHDFNNLLTGILGNLELLQRRANKLGVAEFDDYVKGSRNAANRAVDLSRRLLAVAGYQMLEPTRLNISATLAGVADLAEAIVQPNVVFSLEQPPTPQTVFCDGAQLEEALMNLLRNAQSALADTAGHIKLSSRNETLNADRAALWEIPAGDYVAISVSDTGPGMADTVAIQAFEPFFSTGHAGAGAGLGLAAVLGFARQSGGHAVIEAHGASGTIVTVYLPITI